MTRMLRATWLMLGKELRVELRTGEVTVSTALFATLVTVLSSLSFFVDQESARRVAPGVLWIAITFAGILSMGRSWSKERDNDVFRALLLSPVPRPAIYLSKVAASLTFLLACEAILVVEVLVLFNLELGGVLLPLASLLLLGTLGFCATGNLFAALTVRTRARDMVLAVTVFPVVAPALLAGVVATRDLLGGTPLSEVAGWMRILTAFDIVALTAGVLLFEPLITD